MPLWSHSRLSSFEKCPLQYRFRYIDRIKRDTQSIEAFMGNRVHEVLERLYRDLLEARRPSLDELVAAYHRNWEARFGAHVTIVKTEYTPAHYRDVGVRCLEGYYRRHEPFDQARTLGLEERVVVDLDEASRGRYQLQGYIDRLAQTGDGVYEIHDYKTSSSLPGSADLRKDRQLTLYQMAVQKRHAEAREVRLVWHYLAFDRTLTSSRTPQEIEQHRRSTIGVIDTVAAAKDFPPHESALCRWCEYRDICPAQQHVLRAERKETPMPPRPAGRPVQGRLFD